MKSKIPSTRKLLKFVFKNPNCSAVDISRKFQIEHIDAVCILNGVSDCIVSKTVVAEKERLIVDRCDIQLTAVGRQYLEDKRWDAVCILNGVSDCIVSKTVVAEKERLIVDRCDIQLTAVGRQYLEDKRWDRWLVIASFLVSVASLIVAIVAACISYQTNIASPRRSLHFLPDEHCKPRQQQRNYREYQCQK